MGAPLSDEEFSRLANALLGGNRAFLKQQGGGSSTYPARALLMAEPPSSEAGELTDKGYINQRAVLTRRADRVLELHSDVPDSSVIFV